MKSTGKNTKNVTKMASSIFWNIFIKTFCKYMKIMKIIIIRRIIKIMKI